MAWQKYCLLIVSALETVPYDLPGNEVEVMIVQVPGVELKQAG